jgi:hypothetical protein
VGAPVVRGGWLLWLWRWSVAALALPAVLRRTIALTGDPLGALHRRADGARETGQRSGCDRLDRVHRRLPFLPAHG